MNKNPVVFLQHIINCISLIEEYSKGINEEAFREDVGLQDKVAHRIEIIGEAAKSIPEEFKNAYPQIPWKKITGTRDFLVHEYFRVDLGLLWEIITKEIPDLKEKVLKILEKEKTE